MTSIWFGAIVGFIGGFFFGAVMTGQRDTVLRNGLYGGFICAAVVVVLIAVTHGAIR